MTLMTLSILIFAPLEEIDPEETESEEELYPFIENTYIETDWFKANSHIQDEVNIDQLLLETENLSNFLKKNTKNEYKILEFLYFDSLYLDIISKPVKTNDVFLLNDVLLHEKLIKK